MPVEQKKALRLFMKEKRKSLAQQRPTAGEEIIPYFLNFFNPTSAAIVGAYWPIGTELDVRPLLQELYRKGVPCALPCMTSQGLGFRLWTPVTQLIKGHFSFYEPQDSHSVIPDLVLVPLLAFDKYGHRLGYGQGHYDRFLAAHPMKTVGVGYRSQEVDQVPRQAHDFALDCILTEEGIFFPSILS